MKALPLQRRTMVLVAVLLPMLALFVYVALRSGPLAPIAVVVASVEDRAIAPALFGIGTVDARYTYKIGPTFAGRIRRLDVHVGDHVKAGQVLGEMDPVDLDDRIRGQEAALLSAQAQLREAQARQAYARSQARRYEELGVGRYVSQEMVAGKRQELQVADAGLGAATQQIARARAEGQALTSQRSNLLLVAEVDGIVAVRNADPGTTVVAGQSVVELIDPDTLWINTRFDQVSAHGLKPGLPVRIVLRSQAGTDLPGRVLLVEPMADAVTEEMVAKIAFDRLPVPMPPIGELAEDDQPGRPRHPACLGQVRVHRHRAGAVDRRDTDDGRACTAAWSTTRRRCSTTAAPTCGWCSRTPWVPTPNRPASTTMSGAASAAWMAWRAPPMSPT
jgi:HlyD family secretion protein